MNRDERIDERRANLLLPRKCFAWANIGSCARSSTICFRVKESVVELKIQFSFSPTPTQLQPSTCPQHLNRRLANYNDSLLDSFITLGTRCNAYPVKFDSFEVPRFVISRSDQLLPLPEDQVHTLNSLPCRLCKLRASYNVNLP